VNLDKGTLGARLASAAAEDRFLLHAAEGDRRGFGDYDRVLSGLFDRAIRGEPIIDLKRAARRTETDVVTLKIPDDERKALATMLAPEAQQARGSWYVPEGDKPLVGMIEFAHWAAAEPRFAVNAADAQRAVVTLDGPDAIAIWAALEPVMELLYLPLKLRSGYWLGSRSPEQMTKDWATVDVTYATLAIETGPLAVFKDGRRWATLGIEDVIEARQALLHAWKSARADVGERAIVLLISRLVDRYYQKAKDGKAQRPKVMTKGAERALSGAFGGDWLTFLRYLGEEVHPAEQISTVVASTSMLVSGHDRAAQVAATTGVPVEEIERMLAAYWGDQHDSPVEQRAKVMREWWRSFDELHARQAPGMPSLWGLGGDRLEDIGQNLADHGYTRGGYRILSSELNARIEQLWGTVVLPRWPQAFASEPFPHASFAETLGVGIAFWQEVALTCWFLCEGPYSRADIASMANYYDRQIKALDELNCPIDPAMFDDLAQAEKKLTDRPLEGGDTIERGVGGLSFSITISAGAPKKDGFEQLRDVVTSYRRAWSAQHLERYLHGRWEHELRDVGDTYHRHIADKGKPPTLKQFAKLAEEAANHWFGGDLAQLAGALQLPAPEPQKRRLLLPGDRAAFVVRLRELLGGQRWEDGQRDTDGDGRTRRLRRSELAERAPAVVQIWEATGERPPLKGLSWARERLETAFGADTEAGWEAYLDAVERALREMAASDSVPPPSALVAAEEPDETPPADPIHGIRGLV
jgi:hypothetical protein